MPRYDPRLSDYAGRSWLKAANAALPKGEEVTTYLVDGFPFYRFHGPALWHLPGPDARGHVRARRLVAMLTKAGCRGWNLRRGGCAVWIGIAAMRGLLRRA